MQPWPHQIEAAQYVRDLLSKGKRGFMLAITMGGGKSKITIDLIVELGIRVVLILCPLRVVEVWRQQFVRHAPGQYRFLALDDRYPTVTAKWHAARDATDWQARLPGQKLVIAINYESARLGAFAHWATNRPWPMVIADESHRGKLSNGRTARFLAKLGMLADIRGALTGTPMPHEPLDIWAQFRFLDRNILDATYGAFKVRHAILGGYQGRQIVAWRDLDQLQEKFRSIAFHVGREVLNLPVLVEEALYTTLSPNAARMYREMEQDLITRIETHEVTAANALVKLLRLEQITSGFVRDDETNTDTIIDEAKEKLLEGLLEDLTDNNPDRAFAQFEGNRPPQNEPVVVFAKFKADLKAIHRAARAAGFNSGELSGSRDDLQAWQRGEPNDPTVLAVQIQAGDVGIDLTRARFGVYYSLDYSLAHYLQSQARIYRPPQNQRVAIYHLLVRNSIDEIVWRAVKRRESLIDAILRELPCFHSNNQKQSRNQNPEVQSIEPSMSSRN
ncbi:MAG TPA: DEAD/DEAH box helicase [Bryobacteraceae bacterium]|jgi:SNF2 family DNA or RNA helicase|nr:DEAD/DEAH box helicase [Bryobacteraceae bacterium]